MNTERILSPAAIYEYLETRPARARWLEWLRGRRYLVTRFHQRSRPLGVIAYYSRDRRAARKLALAVEQDWTETSRACQDAYDEILFKAPGLIVIQLRQKNVCKCLGHRHLAVREAPFAEAHEAFLGTETGEIDLAYQDIDRWLPMPISDSALDAKFLEGSRLEEFHSRQFRLKILSITLHEINHLVSPQADETAVRHRSLTFYHDAMADYVDNAISTLSLTIDRSFSRFG
ncbi:MAG TPA: hypothetical protein VMX16_07555 [Terriglobia bacterium]|nr:hypothetical protein [Terriglobia bacterium]